MGIAKNFEDLCGNLIVDNKSDISSRYKQITKRLNSDFYISQSETEHSWYIGSYGRSTAINGFHDLDVLYQLPAALYAQYNAYTTNGQSALLQAVRASLLKTYPNTKVGADGVVVVVPFTDGMRFEILPAFLNIQATYTYPDSSNGGSWKITSPFQEIEEMRSVNSSCNDNLYRLCRMMRAWRRKYSVPIKGLLLDTIATQFIRQWTHRDKSYFYYDFITRDFLLYLSEQKTTQTYWKAPGSGQYVYRTGQFEAMAKTAYNVAVAAIKYETDGYPATARNKWKEIYGTFYP